MRSGNINFHNIKIYKNVIRIASIHNSGWCACKANIRSSEKVFWRKVLDIYATSIDYDPRTEALMMFFKQCKTKCIGQHMDKQRQKKYIILQMPKVCHHNNWAANEDLLSKYGSRLMALHLHDNGCSRNQHCMPFDGTIDWSATMKAIADTGYLGATALEVMNWDYEDLSAKEFLHKAFERAKRLEALRLYNP